MLMSSTSHPAWKDNAFTSMCVSIDANVVIASEAPICNLFTLTGDVGEAGDRLNLS